MISCCPLCKCEEYRELELIPFKAIWQSLSDIWGARFSKKVIEKYSVSSHAFLVECRECGLQYFRNSISADADFYNELTSTSTRYYNVEKWEFDVIADRLTHEMSVLDIGCGEGRFIKKISDKVRFAVGIETNPAAVAIARKNSINIVQQDMNEFSHVTSNQFDYVCVFQVVEHLDNVTEFLMPARNMLKEGGCLVVSVPNRESKNKEKTIEPLDCPPHHVSRWHYNQFERLARILDLTPVCIDYELLDVYAARSYFREQLTNDYFSFIFPGKDLLVRIVVRMVMSNFFYELYRRLGILSMLKLHGQSMVLTLRRNKQAD